jgi:hypothetical protein
MTKDTSSKTAKSKAKPTKPVAAKKATTIAPARTIKPRITFSEELISTIFNRVSSGESINKICSTPDMPCRNSFFEWVDKSEDVQRRYQLAIIARTDFYAEEIIAISDDGSKDTYLDGDGNERTDNEVVARAKLRIDARKWFVSKMNPKKYGDKLELSGDPTSPLVVVKDFSGTK